MTPESAPTVRDLAQINKLHALPTLLSMIAARAGSEVNVNDIAKSLGLSNTTTAEYINLLRLMYLMVSVPSWSRENLTKRLVKSPKLFMGDSGLMSHLIYADAARFQVDGVAFGSALENFVAGELLKEIATSDTQPTLWHMRDSAGTEVDFVLERGPYVVGIEVKTTSNPGARDFAGLRALQTIAGKQFVRGILLYTGEQVLPHGENIMAVPLSALWA